MHGEGHNLTHVIVGLCDNREKREQEFLPNAWQAQRVIEK
jgi:hypothetical protein